MFHRHLLTVVIDVVPNIVKKKKKRCKLLCKQSNFEGFIFIELLEKNERSESFSVV
jgi:hypothetical protein